VKVQPGLAFSVPLDARNALGVMTKELPRIGALVWIGSETFAEAPTLLDAESNDRWRWPVFFPLASAVRKKLVDPLGVIALPPEIALSPRMRSGNKARGWVACEERDGQMVPIGPTSDPSLPIYSVVNLTRLKEMVSTNWRPEDSW
jgi:hypothetical protein